jgi:hypothetical protein
MGDVHTLHAACQQRGNGPYFNTARGERIEPLRGS